MRPIKFRGKRWYDGQWIIGSLIIEDDGIHSIFHYDKFEISGSDEVIKESIGQFTGLHDKNGKEIYEGDIVIYCEMEYKIIYQANEFHCGYYLAYMFEDNPCLELGKQRTNIIEVISNIYEKEQ